LFRGWTAADAQRGFVTRSSCCGLWVPIFFPDCQYTLAWDMMGLVFIIFETFALPMYLAFRIQPVGFWFGFVCLLDAYFVLDIPLNFIRGFKESNGLTVMQPILISRRYCRWIAFDILAGIPWEWLPMLHTHGSTWAQLTKMLRLLRVARLLRLLRLQVLPDTAKLYIESSNWLTFVQGVMRVLFCLFSITHWAACIWFFIGNHSDLTETWVAAHMPKNADIATEYMYSLYFTLTTMTTVGYGDITPQNDDEVLFTLILLLVATVVFATLMGALTDLICSLQSEKHTQDSRMRMLSHYMNWRQVPTDLFKAIRRHMVHLWETNKGYDAYEEEVKQNLPPVLRKELCYHVYGSILRTTPFLGWLWDYETCLKELANGVHSLILSRGDRVFRHGQANTSMFVLQSGLVRISLNESLFGFQLTEDEHRAENDQQDNDHELIVATLGAFRQPGRSLSNAQIDPAVRRKGLQSQVLCCALEKIRVQDEREKWAAMLIQRLWQRRKMRFHKPKKVKKMHHITSRTVPAPAYFGEACLWTPFDAWASEEPPSHTYSARCEAISEVMIIPRVEVRELIQRFSPWLRDRFETFRQEVLAGMESQAAEAGWRRVGGDASGGASARSAAGGATPAMTEHSAEEVCHAAGEQLALLAFRSRAAASKLMGSVTAPRRGEALNRSWSTLREPLLRSSTASPM